MLKTKKVSVRVPLALHREARKKLFDTDLTFQRFVVEKLREFVGMTA
jgi:hypothetical protein